MNALVEVLARGHNVPLMLVSLVATTSDTLGTCFALGQRDGASRLGRQDGFGAVLR